MKKVIRSFTAVILAGVIMLCAGMNAFAATDGLRKIKWNDWMGDDYEFYYGNIVLEEGETLISYYDPFLETPDASDQVTEDDVRGLACICYEFEAEESGYYMVSSEYGSVYMFADTYDGETASGSAENICCSGEVDYYIVYLEEGKNLFGAYIAVESYVLMDTVNIEYLGAEIVDYSVSEESLDDFIIGIDVWEENSDEFALDTTCEISFSSDKEVSAVNVCLMGTCPSTPKEGKSKATVELFGIEKEVEFTAYYIDTLVRSVELNNIDDYTEFAIDYAGNRNYGDSSGETLKVVFNDISEISVVLNEGMAEIALPTGAVVPVYAGLGFNDEGSYVFVITVCGKVFEEYEVTERNNGFGENILALATDNFECINSSSDNFITGIQYITADMDFAKVCFELAFDDLTQMFTNFINFVKYYIG